MQIDFQKMNGAGNDFVVIDNRALGISLDAGQIRALCDRHRGVGADGLLAVEPAVGEADFRMRYYNSDGGEAEMCGNGARCFARFCRFLDGERHSMTFETGAGIVSATFDGELVEVGLSEPHSWMPVRTIRHGGEELTVCSVNTGVPHAVVFVDGIEALDVAAEGSFLRHHEIFQPDGTNVNFAQSLPSGDLAIRTYERGVEEETLACGTGVAAAALVHARRSGAGSPIGVRVRGGDRLEVSFERSGSGYTDVRLKGPADFVFEGRISL